MYLSDNIDQNLPFIVWIFAQAFALAFAQVFARRLSEDCIESARRLLGIAWELHGDCIEIALSLHGSCMEVAWRLHGNLLDIEVPRRFACGHWMGVCWGSRSDFLGSLLRFLSDSSYFHGRLLGDLPDARRLLRVARQLAAVS